MNNNISYIRCYICYKKYKKQSHMAHIKTFHHKICVKIIERYEFKKFQSIYENKNYKSNIKQFFKIHG